MSYQEAGYLKTTVVFPGHEDTILLGKKKRGFGEGWWNGFGGKLHPGEEYEDSARRESLEEAGIYIKNLLHVANLHFYFDGELGVVSRAYAASYSGKPFETDEMEPQDFLATALPFEQMWPADQLWVPKVLVQDAKFPLGFIIHFDGAKAFKSIEEVNPADLEDKF